MVNYWEILTTWNRLQKFQYEPIEKIRRYQLKQFKKLIQYAYEYVPMYREFYDSHNFKPVSICSYEDIEKVPIINKKMIRNFSLEKRIDTQTKEKRIYKETTSGSTGQPMAIWTAKTESFIESLKSIRFLREWAYSPFYNTVQLWRTDVEPKKMLVQKFGLFRRQLISILDNPDTVVGRLKRSQCDVLFATRSSLEIFSEELNKRGVKITPKILVSCCEVLTDEQRQFFQETYGCAPLEIYGAVETGNIAWECPTNNQNLHIEMESVLINFRDIQSMEDGTQIASIIATNLKNHVMPFIRYDLGDLIILPESTQCPCGRTLPLLGKIFGRNDDILEYSGRKFNFHFFYNYFKNYLYINRYKVVQTKMGDIEFRVHLFDDTEGTRQRCLSDLSSDFSDLFSPLNVKFVEGFPISSSGKFKVIEKVA